MRWVVAFFIALVSIPVAQVVADTWSGRAGPHISVVPSHGTDFARSQRHYRLYDPFAPWFPTKAKTG
ncbi:MAG TPA: hypothetical protein VIY51_11670 [Xanthobacteraceae bacterium]